MTDTKEIELDFKVYEGYVAFSSEIVRLALLSPAIFAFFVALAGKEPTATSLRVLIAPASSSLAVSLVFMGLAVFCGLAHRYCAIDFMSELLNMKRKGKESFRNWRLAASYFFIVAAPLSLLLGACSLFVAVFRVLGGI
jgi:hypothetical protein